MGITELILNNNLIAIEAQGMILTFDIIVTFYMRKMIITCQPSLSLRPLV